MGAFLGQGLYFGYNLFLFMLFFWIWIPGILISALLTLRYRQAAAERLIHGHSSACTTLWAATLLGMTGSPHRQTSLQTARILLAGGVSPVGVLTFLIASHSLVIYFLAVLTLLLGVEFAVGQALGAILMIVLVAGIVPFLLPARDERQPATSPEAALRLLMADHPMTPSWTTLIFTPRGWGEILKYIGREFRRFGVNTLTGIFLGGFFLAGGLEPWWFDLASLGGGGVPTDLLHALLAPLLAVILSVPPLGNLPLTMALFKSYTLNYPGIVSFVLASLVHPAMIRAYTACFGKREGHKVSLILLGAAAVCGLLVTGIFGLIDFRPGHTPVHPLHKLWQWLRQG